MKVLFIAPRFPYPLMQGDRLRAYELLRRLHKTHSITLVAPISREAATYAPLLCEQWLPVITSRSSQYRQLLQALPSSLPLQVALLCPPALIQQVQVLLQQQQFDLVHIHTARVAPAIVGSSVPYIVDLIDALSLNMARRAEREVGPKRWLFQAEAKRMAAYEQQLINQSGAATVVASADQQALGNSSKLHVIPMGVDQERFHYQPKTQTAPIIVFSGRMAYFPNADAAYFLATEIFPLVRQQYPTAQLRIVGADPPWHIRKLQQLPGVVVTGYVPEIAAELHQASVAVAPLRAGTGQQIKVLEAMASGTPVVATPLAIAGVAAEHGQHVLIAEAPADLAAAIIQIISQPILGQQLAKAAHTLIELRYTWEYTTQAFIALYDQVANKPAKNHSDFVSAETIVTNDKVSE